MSWLRLDEDVLSHPQVAQLVAEQGPNGVAAWIFTLTTAKRRNGLGIVALSALVMGRECGLSTELAATAITALVTNGLVMVTSKPDVYQVPNWHLYQPDSRPASKDRAPRESQGVPGLRDGTNGTGPDEEKPSARAPRRGGQAARRQADSELRQAVMRGEL